MKDVLNKKEKSEIEASIIICVWNNLTHTMNCLESIVKYTHLSYEIILIDNHSEEPVIQTTMDFLNKNNIDYTIVLNKENKGFIKATNQGIKLARGQFIVLLNNDVKVTNNWLTKMIDIINNNKRIGIVSCLASPSNIGWQPINNLRGKVSWLKDLPTYEGKTVDEYAKIVEDTYRGKYKTVGMVAFFCTVIKKNVVNDIGLLDEDYGIGLIDDVDYCQRASLKGYMIALALDTYVYHYHRATFDRLNIDWREIVKENKKKFQKKFGKLYCW
ncbi:MAG: hypothetical protein PWP27_503 [Clostridiales bacterium]|jgi:GT2 family glycosyltransferase|nr:hypothetical protein [Clostridiales bacterium]MDK2932693.1 hypothetical protein [Clostridiales bacterium]